MENKTFEEIIKSEYGVCFGGFDFSCEYCKDCELKNRCKNLTEELDNE